MIHLRVRDCTGTVREMETVESIISIGQAPESTLRLPFSRVEWRHGQIFERRNRIFYRDLNSPYGTLLRTSGGQVRVDSSNQEKELQPGDRIEIGGNEITILASERDRYPLDPEEVPFVETSTRENAQSVVQRLEKDHQVLELIYRFEKQLSTVFDLDEILEAISNAIFSVFEKATHLFVVFVEDDDLELAFTRRREGVGEEERSTGLSRMIVEQVIRTGEAITFGLTEAGGFHIHRQEDVEVDPTKSVRLNRIKSGICAPLWSGTSIIGVLEVDNRVEMSAFRENERDLLVLFANRAAMAVEKHRRYLRSLQQTRDVAIGQVASKVVHDMVNHFAVLRLMAEVSENTIKKAEKNLDSEMTSSVLVKQFLAKIHDCVQKISLHQELVWDLLDDLRHYGKERKPDYAQIDLEKIVTECEEVSLFRATQREKEVHLETRGEWDSVSLLADPGGVRRIFQNLLNNAVDAVEPQDGSIEVGVEGAQVNNLPYVCISVKDNGTGIPPDIVERVFEYGFTTKEGVSGSGFGLAVIQKVVGEHRGFIRVFSREGEGTEVHVYFPAVQNQEELEQYPDRRDGLVEISEWES